MGRVRSPLKPTLPLLAVKAARMKAAQKWAERSCGRSARPMTRTSKYHLPTLTSNHHVGSEVPEAAPKLGTHPGRGAALTNRNLGRFHMRGITG
jgi:hypothetical protein